MHDKNVDTLLLQFFLFSSILKMLQVNAEHRALYLNDAFSTDFPLSSGSFLYAFIFQLFASSCV